MADSSVKGGLISAILAEENGAEVDSGRKIPVGILWEHE